jgi:HTH-type transcriptional regulator/antitoxin HigA
MIKNSKQAALAKRKLEELKAGLTSYAEQKRDMHPVQYELGVNTFEELIRETESELQLYQQLSKQLVKELTDVSIRDLPMMLIAARLGANMSQKELGEKIGVHEQQIQRYEADEYEKTSWGRIEEILEALDFNIELARVPIVKVHLQDNVKRLVPVAWQDADVNEIAYSVKTNGWFAPSAVL